MLCRLCHVISCTDMKSNIYLPGTKKKEKHVLNKPSIYRRIRVVYNIFMRAHNIRNYDCARCHALHRFFGRRRITTTLRCSPQTIKPIPGDGFTASFLFIRQYLSNIADDRGKKKTNKYAKRERERE